MSIAELDYKKELVDARNEERRLFAHLRRAVEVYQEAIKKLEENTLYESTASESEKAEVAAGKIALDAAKSILTASKQPTTKGE
jgi:hypothetical protein